MKALRYFFALEGWKGAQSIRNFSSKGKPIARMPRSKN